MGPPGPRRLLDAADVDRDRDGREVRPRRRSLVVDRRGGHGRSAPILAALTAVVVVQVSVRASVRTALQRSGAVVLGVLVAIAIGDALDPNGPTVALLVGVSLGVAQLVLRLPPGAARQVPLSGLVVLSAVATSQPIQGWRRALDTVLGAIVGVTISLLLPASRRVDARQTPSRLSTSLGDLLDAMGEGLQRPWSTEQRRNGGAPPARRGSGSSTRPPRRSAMAASPPAGTFAIGVTSRRSVATSKSCRGWTARLSASP